MRGSDPGPSGRGGSAPDSAGDRRCGTPAPPAELLGGDAWHKRSRRIPREVAHPSAGSAGSAGRESPARRCQQEKPVHSLSIFSSYPNHAMSCDSLHEVERYIEDGFASELNLQLVQVPLIVTRERCPGRPPGGRRQHHRAQRRVPGRTLLCRTIWRQGEGRTTGADQPAAEYAGHTASCL